MQECSERQLLALAQLAGLISAKQSAEVQLVLP